MAKRKSTRPCKPMVSVNAAGETTVKTGIFKTVIPAESRGEVIDGDRLSELIAADLARLESDRRKWATSARRVAWRFLEPFLVEAPNPLPKNPRDWPKGHTARRLDFGEAPAIWLVRELDRTTGEGIAASEALALLEKLDSVKHERGAAAKLHAAFAAGRLFERLFVRTLENRALSQVKSSEAGNAKKSKAAEQRRKEYREAVSAEMERQKRAGEQLRYGDAVVGVAERYAVSERTVSIAVPNRWTKQGRPVRRNLK